MAYSLLVPIPGLLVSLRGASRCSFMSKSFLSSRFCHFLDHLPKCGTTWLKALTFTLINRKKHSPLNQEHPLLIKNPHNLVPFLDIELYGASKLPDFSSFMTPRLFATHSPIGLLPKSVLESKCKLVYLCRSPKDMFISNWHFAEKCTRLGNFEGISSFEEGFNMFCNGINFGGPFWDHVLEGWHSSLEKPDQVLFLTYEELQSEPLSMLRSLANFLGYRFSLEEEDSGMEDAVVKLCSFENLSNLEVNRGGGKILMTKTENKEFFRKGKVGDWKNHLNAEMADRIDVITERKFQGSGLLELKSPTFSKSVMI